MGDDEQLFFEIPKFLNSGKRLMGLPQDEILPALIIFLGFFIAKHYIIGGGIAAMWFMGLRMIKVQYGENIIVLALFWWGNKTINQLIFKRTPPSEKRYWIF